MEFLKYLLVVVAVIAIPLLSLQLYMFLSDWHENRKIRKDKGIEKRSSKISATDLILFVFIIISRFFKKIISALKWFFQNFSRKIWRSRFRWWWVGIIAFLVLAYGWAAYTRFATDEGYGIKTAGIEHTQKGTRIIFELPEGLKHPRVEILENIVVQTAGTNIVGFMFSNAVMYEYLLAGQKKIDRAANKVTKWAFDMPFHKENNLEMLEYHGHKGRKTETRIWKGSEIEWSEPPYIIIAKTRGNVPFKLSITPIRYRVVDQNSLGKIVPEKKNK